MIPLYTQEELNSAKCRQLLPFRCEQCLKIFYSPKNIILISLRGKSKHTLQFCTKSCAITHRGPSVQTTCKQCNKSFKKKACQIKKSKNNFCSSSCAAKYNNTHKTKGTRVSKLEIWLQKKLTIIYPTLYIHFNRKDTINGELDIYIPSLKLAFELNGIFHYEPIYGSNKLSSIQTNDNRKMQACLERKIELCIIDVSSMSYFKEKNAQKYLDIITNLINLKNGANDGA